MAVEILNHKRRLNKHSQVAFQAVDPVTTNLIIGSEDNRCIVEAVLEYASLFVKNDCCGRCAPCRDGARQTRDILAAIVTGKGVTRDMERLNKITFVLEKASMCRLGKEFSSSIRFNVKHFENEYWSHIERNVCSTIYVANKKLVIA